MSKLYEWLSIFFAGIIAGIILYVKTLDKPDTVVINKIGKQKVKNGSGDNNATFEDTQYTQDDFTKEVKHPKRKKFFNKIFKKKK